MSYSTFYSYANLFPLGVWGAIRQVFDGASLRGCAFHWSKAVQAKAKELKVPAAVRADEKQVKILQRCQHLQFLPASHIPEAFRALEESSRRYGVDDPLPKFIGYIRRQWIESVTFPPSSWSQFGARTRTNNDLEGYHRGLNADVGARPHLYTFLQAVAKEAEKTQDVVSVEDFMRRSRPAQTRREQRLIKLQDRYMDREITAGAYLDSVRDIYSKV